MSDSKYNNLIFEQPNDNKSMPQLPRSDGGIASIPAIAFVAGAGLAYKVGFDWIPKLKSESAIIVKHLSSEPPEVNEGHFSAHFLLENVSLHTVYVENILVSRPDIGAEVIHIPEPKMSYATSESVPLPWKVLSHKQVMFSINIQRNRLPLNFDKEPYGSFKIETSILHRKSTNISDNIVFRIRDA